MTKKYRVNIIYTVDSMHDERTTADLERFRVGQALNNSRNIEEIQIQGAI